LVCAVKYELINKIKILLDLNVPRKNQQAYVKQKFKFFQTKYKIFKPFLENRDENMKISNFQIIFEWEL
jgi:hypothetical protein